MAAMVRDPALFWRRGMSLPQLWAFLAVALPAVAALATMLATIDLTYHIRAGDLMIGSGEVLRMDSFSFTAAGRDWTNQQWGAQVVVSLAFRGGWIALAALRALLVAAIAWLVYLGCRTKRASRRTAALLTLASFLVALGGLALRPQLMGVLLFACAAWLLAGRDEHPNRLWLLVPLATLWANVHGSFFLGPLLVGTAWLEDVRTRSARAGKLLLLTLVASGATLVNPFGVRVWTYVVTLSVNRNVTETVTEWQAPTIRTLIGAVFFLSIVAVGWTLASRRPKLTPWAYVRMAVYLMMGLFAYRGIIWWAVAAPVELAGGFASSRAEDTRPAAVNVAIALVLTLFGAVLLTRWAGQEPLRPSDRLVFAAPPGVTAAAARHADDGDRIFVAQRWGSWFELALPRNPVFVDSRIEIYPDSVWREFFAVSGGREGWQEILDRWDVEIVVAEAEEEANLLSRIEDDPDWRLVHEDGDGAVFTREP